MGLLTAERTALIGQLPRKAQEIIRSSRQMRRYPSASLLRLLAVELSPENRPTAMVFIGGQLIPSIGQNVGTRTLIAARANTPGTSPTVYPANADMRAYRQEMTRDVPNIRLLIGRSALLHLPESIRAGQTERLLEMMDGGTKVGLLDYATDVPAANYEFVFTGDAGKDNQSTYIYGETHVIAVDDDGAMASLATANEEFWDLSELSAAAIGINSLRLHLQEQAMDQDETRTELQWMLDQLQDQ